MVRGWALSLLCGATLAWGAGPTDAAVPRGHEERVPAPRLERPSDTTCPTVDELLERAGLHARLGALADGIRLRLRTLPAGLTVRDRAEIDGIAARYFDPDTLYARVRLELGESLDAPSLRAALEWHRSALGRRITRAEVRALADGDGAVPPSSEERLALVQRLDAGGGSSQTALDLLTALARSLARATDSVRPAHLRLRPAQLEARLADARLEWLAPLRIGALRHMLFTYRDLSDVELGEYVRFVESARGRGWVEATNRALVDTVSSAAELAAAELVTRVPHLSERR